jgi:hypothetical protein
VISTQILQMPKPVVKKRGATPTKENAAPEGDQDSPAQCRPNIDFKEIPGKAAEFKEKREALASKVLTDQEGTTTPLALAETPKIAAEGPERRQAVFESVLKKFSNARASPEGLDSLSHNSSCCESEVRSFG